MTRIELVEECEHGMEGIHETSECWAHDKRHKEQADCYCRGGSRRVMDEPTDDMIEAVAEVLFLQRFPRSTWGEGTSKRAVYVGDAKAGLAKAWAVLKGDTE